MPYDATIPGYMYEVELKAIEKIANRVGAGSIVEIGSFIGRSAVAWASSAPHALVYCIDIWDNYPSRVRYPENTSWDIPHGDLSRFDASLSDEENFRKNTADHKNIIPMRGKSTEDWPLSDLDCVFIDGDHGYNQVYADLVHWLPRIRPGGLLCGHDLSPLNRLVQTTQAVLAFAHDRKLSIFNIAGTSLWLMIKSKDHLNYWWYA